MTPHISRHHRERLEHLVRIAVGLSRGRGVYCRDGLGPARGAGERVVTDAVTPAYGPLPHLSDESLREEALQGPQSAPHGHCRFPGAAERRLGLAEALAGCIREWRDPERVVHTLPAMLRFRMFAIACPRPGRPSSGPTGRRSGTSGAIRALRRHGQALGCAPLARRRRICARSPASVRIRQAGGGC